MTGTLGEEMRQEENPQILVHCTVDRSFIQVEAGSFVCTMCNRKLVDTLAPQVPERPGEKGSGGRATCGIVLGVRLAAVASTLAFGGCEDSKEQVVPVGPVGTVDIGGKLVEEIKGKEFPRAELVRDGDPDWVISPYTGQHVSVEGIPAGALVTDPSFSIEEQKYFRLPEAAPPAE